MIRCRCRPPPLSGASRAFHPRGTRPPGAQEANFVTTMGGTTMRGLVVEPVFEPTLLLEFVGAAVDLPSDPDMV